ncbi:hypothetical protein B0H14DRAFT_2185738, partial [Mycena olivaceomarginata]
DTSLEPEEQAPDDDGISVRVKAKHYQNSDLPFLTWVDYRDEYLDEMNRGEGRGNRDIYSACECTLRRHEVLPTHWIQQEWNGTFFKHVSLKSLGLVVQLGHTPGSSCSTMRKGKYKFTLIDIKGVHNIAVQFCHCDERITHRQQLMRVCWWPATVVDPSTCATFNVLRLFQNMNCLGKISAFHFLRSLELLTNADGLNPPPVSLRSNENGDRYLTARDPIIDDGLGYFCNRELYKKFLHTHVDKEEISTCSGFQAMFLANAKRVKGLRTMGVGGVTCVRTICGARMGLGTYSAANGTYSNMDFILFSLILNTILLYLILSYDIACQFSKNFWTRMKGLPEWMHIDPEKVFVWFKVPNFHILGHKWPCHSPFSFHWMWGAGMTDGEDVEQNWDFTNGAAPSTKMMGPGGRHAFLEGLFAFHNWWRTVS